MAGGYHGEDDDDLELDEDELFGQDNAEGSRSGSHSDSQSDTDDRPGARASPSIDGSGDEGGAARGRVAQGGRLPNVTGASFGNDNLKARATAAQALAAKHPGMMGGSDSNVSLTRAIPGNNSNLRRTVTGMGPRTRGEAAMAAAAAKLGSSVPIAIPMAARDQKAAEMKSSPTDRDDRAATFVPPHLLEQRADGATTTSFSLHGTSPAASLKRVRLVNRNNVLRSIGFLEDNTGAASGITDTMDPIREANEDPFSSSPAAVGFSISPSINSLKGASGLSSAIRSASVDRISRLV